MVVGVLPLALRALATSHPGEVVVVAPIGAQRLLAWRKSAAAEWMSLTVGIPFDDL